MVVSKMASRMEQMEQLLAKAKADNIKRKTFKAFARFDATGDARVLHGSMSPDNPLWANILRVDSVKDSKENRKLLTSAGVEDLEGFFSGAKDIGNFVVTTSPDGKRTLLDMNSIQAMTGYTKTLAKSALTTKSSQTLMADKMRKGQSFKTIKHQERNARLHAERKGIDVHEAAKNTFSVATPAEQLIIESAAEYRGYKKEQDTLAQESVDRVGILNPETGDIEWQA